MRHIALLSALCLTVSVSVLASSAQSAAPQDLKERLAAARLEASRNEAVVTPKIIPETAQRNPVKNAEQTTDIIKPPLMGIDAMPKPGTTIPLVSSSVMTAPVTTAPVAAPKVETKKEVEKKPEAIKTVATKEAVQTPASTKAKDVETIKKDIMNAKAVPIIQEKPVAKNAIIWDEQKTVQAEKKAPTKVKEKAEAETVRTEKVVAQRMTSEQIIPNEKLNPAVLPDVMLSVAPVATAATAATAKTEKAKTEAKTADAKNVSDVKTEKVKAAKAEKVKTETKTAETKTAQSTKSTISKSDQALLPMPSTVKAPAPTTIDATKSVAAKPIADVPAVPVIPDTSTKKLVSNVPASSPTGAWTTRLVGSKTDKDSAFCLLENKFSNHSSLMIGQRSDGYSTIGVNYGVDMLDTGRNYSTLVMVDDQFEESFNGYAESGRMMIVQLGKKPSFFAQLTNAQNLRVVLQGVASNFATQGVGSALQEFSTCLTSIGGALPEQAPITTLAAGQNMPAVPVATVNSDDLVPPPIATPNAVPSATTQAKTPSALPVVTAPSQAVQVTSNWSDRVRKILTIAGIRTKNIQQNAGVTEWSDEAGMHGQVWQVPGADLLEASMTQLDNAETECQGDFTNQIGTPELMNGHNIQLMESKCASASGVSISTWLIQQNPQGAITAWEMRANQTDNASSFDARQKILGAIQSQPNS